MLQEHSAILSTFIKLPFVFKTFVLSIFEWPLKTGFTFTGFLSLISVYPKTIDHFNLKLLIFIGIVQVLRFDFQKFRSLEILNFHP